MMFQMMLGIKKLKDANLFGDYTYDFMIITMLKVNMRKNCRQAVINLKEREQYLHME